MFPVCCQYKPLRAPQVKAPNYRVAERFPDACLPEVCAFPTAAASTQGQFACFASLLARTLVDQQCCQCE